MQTMFILQNPLTYAGTLLRFIETYLHRFLANNYVTRFAHLGASSYSLLTLALVGFTTLTDRNESDTHTSAAKNKALISLLVFSTIAIFSTALYIDFTEVGRDTIAGVQPRYLLPLLFPFLYVVGSFKIKNNMNKRAYSSCIFGIISFVLLVGAWEMLLPHTI